MPYAKICIHICGMNEKLIIAAVIAAAAVVKKKKIKYKRDVENWCKVIGKIKIAHI